MNIVLVESLDVSDEILNSFRDEFIKKGHRFSFINNLYTNSSNYLDEIKRMDILIVANTDVPLEILEKAENLKYISVAFTGVDHVPLHFCKENNIIVSNCSGYSDDSVSELVFGLILNISRNIIKCDFAVRNSKTKVGLLGFEIKGKVIGIVGLGRIGFSVAKKALAFGMTVLSYSRSQDKEAIDLGIKYVDLDYLMMYSDIVSLHLPYNDKTHFIINERMLSLMKEGAIIINTARGNIIDNLALSKLVNSGTLLAGIDVYEVEPPIQSSHPLVSSKNVLLTPHIAFATKESMINRANMAFENVKNFLDNKIIREVKL